LIKSEKDQPQYMVVGLRFFENLKNFV